MRAVLIRQIMEFEAKVISDFCQASTVVQILYFI